jgi:polar amino acid transport system substrate-binding protein
MKKFSTLLFILAAFAIVLAACGSAEEESTYDKVMKESVVRVGVRNDNPPLSYIDDGGNWIGFDVDLANALADEMGVEIEMVVVDGTTRISFLQEDRVDMSVASMNHTRQRDDAVDFSITYFWDNQSFLIRRGTYTSIDELMGRQVAANAGSSAIPSWQAYSAENGGPEPEFVEFTDKVAAVQALRDGAVEGYTEDNITLLVLAAGDPDLELLPGGHNPVQFGIGVPVNDSLWRDQVNYALQELWKDGRFQDIYEKWFGPGAEIERPIGGEMEIWPE